MLIAIKGFEMPETCIMCPMQFGGWCGVSPAEIDERVAETPEEALIQKRPQWCPLVEVGQKHATWIERGGIFACSNCGAEDGVMTQFCSSCGYQMDGGAEIEAEPVRHGRWVMLEEYSLHGEKYADYACQYCEHRISRAKGFCPNFCEDCGAKMDGGAENESE